MFWLSPHKAILFLCFVLLATIPALSMDFAIGIKAGAGHFSFYGLDYEEYKDRDGLNFAMSVLKLGFSAGFFATLGFSDSLAIQAEAFFSLGGDAHRTRNVTRSVNIFFLDFPLLLKGRLPLGPGTAAIFVGPELLIKLGKGRLAVELTGQGTTIDNEIGTDAVNAYQFGIVAGAEYAVPLGPGQLFFDLRAMLGLTNIHPTAYIAHNELKGSSGLLMVGYGLDLGGS